jgi:hypothetical protein
MPHADIAVQLVEQPAIELSAALDRTTVSALLDLRRTRGLVLPRLLSGQVNLGETDG